jgi:hypothetical protein
MSRCERGCASPDPDSAGLLELGAAPGGVVLATDADGGSLMRVRSAVAGVLALVALGCGYSIKSNTNYDHGVDFSAYDTFFMIPGSSSGDPLLDQRATTDVETALTNRGWVETPAGQGRAAVVVHAATRTKHNYQTFYDGWGGWGWDGPWLGATNSVEDYQVGTLVVDIFDATTKRVIWRGHASDALPNDRTDSGRATQAAVAKLFAGFPPGSPPR